LEIRSMHAHSVRLLALALLVALAAAAQPAAAQQLAVQRHKLSNGLVALTLEDHSIPVISFYIFYRVGSRNERPGITGVSHLFEHMMFNGSAKYKPKQFDLLLETAGSGGNGYTNTDFTAYLETFPPAALDTVLDLEADRMRSLLITAQNLEQERGIVQEERRSSTDNVPAARMYEEMMAAAFVAHPYGWPVVGWMGDLKAIKLEEAQRYFDNFYGPNNATVVIVGDFSTPDLLKRLEASLGSVPSRGRVDPVVDAEPPQEGERRVDLVKDASLPAVMIGYKTPAVKHADYPALKVLETVLGRGESSRVYRQLVYAGLAAETSVTAADGADPGLFTLYAQAQEGKTAAECEAALYKVLREVRASGVAPEELQKAKNQLRADFARAMQTTDGKANRLGAAEIQFGDYAALFTLLDRYDAVTNDDLKRVANEYLVKRRRTVVTLVLPKEQKEVSDE
jgi:zinc protease